MPHRSSGLLMRRLGILNNGFDLTERGELFALVCIFSIVLQDWHWSEKSLAGIAIEHFP